MVAVHIEVDIEVRTVDADIAEVDTAEDDIVADTEAEVESDYWSIHPVSPCLC